jgi:hypothetical protein
MCEQCIAMTKLWKEPIIPGWWLVQATRDGDYMKKDEFGIVMINDPSFVFKTIPQVIESKPTTTEEFHKMQDFQDDIENCGRVSFIDIYFFMKGCVKAGADTTYFYAWLSNRLVEVMKSPVVGSIFYSCL